MVGFHLPEIKFKERLLNNEPPIAGALSGCMTRVFTMPFDVLKIRFQLQLEDIRESRASKYHGMAHALRMIIKEEKFSALWKGHAPAQALSTTYGLLQFSSFEYLTKKAWEYFPQHLSNDSRPILHFFCGSASGCIATVGSMPFDVVRTRLVSQGEPQIYNGFMHAMFTMAKNEGPKSFFRGLSPAVIQVAPYSGVQFYVYTSLTRRWRQKLKSKYSNVVEIGWLPSLICGMAAGLVAKTIMYPFDLTKKRLQVQGFEIARRRFGRVTKYSGALHCIQVVIAEERLRGMYKGFVPSCMKSSLATGCNFCFYEKILNMLRRINSEDAEPAVLDSEIEPIPDIEPQTLNPDVKPLTSDPNRGPD